MANKILNNKNYIIASILSGIVSLGILFFQANSSSGRVSFGIYAQNFGITFAIMFGALVLSAFIFKVTSKKLEKISGQLIVVAIFLIIYDLTFYLFYGNTYPSIITNPLSVLTLMKVVLGYIPLFLTFNVLNIKD